jgi:hypothetical protein
MLGGSQSEWTVRGRQYHQPYDNRRHRADGHTKEHEGHQHAKRVTIAMATPTMRRHDMKPSARPAVPPVIGTG